MRGLALLLLAVLLGACGSSVSQPGTDTADADAADGAGVATYLTIESPPSDSWWSHSTLLVTGVAWSRGDDSVQVNGQNVPLVEGRFSTWIPLVEGPNTITALLPQEGLQQSVKVNVDRLPPLLDTQAPDRGGVVASPDSGVSVRFTASDENGLGDLVAGGIPVAVEAVQPQSVVATALLKSGINLLTAEATDTHGNLAREHRSVLAGPFVPCAELANSTTVMMVLGSQALDVLGQATSGLLADMDFAPYLQQNNPLYASETFELNVNTLELVDPVLDLDTTSAPSGRMTVSFLVETVVASGTLTLVSSGTTYQFQVEVDSLELTLSADVGLSQGTPKKIQVVPQQVVTDAFAVTLQMTDAGGNDVVPSTEISGNFLQAVGDMAAGFASDALANVLAGALPQASGTQELELLGMPVRFNYSLLQLNVSPSGLSVSLGAQGEVTSSPVHAWSHGCPGPIPPQPTASSHPGIQVWLSYPFLNSIFLSLWQQGKLDFKLDQAKMDAWKSQMTLVCGMLGSLLTSTAPQITEAPLVVDVVPALPPQVATSAVHQGALALTVGDLQLAFRCGVEPQPVASAWLSLELGTLLAVLGGKIHVGLAVDRFLLDTQGLGETAKRMAEKEMETFFEQTIQQIAGAVVNSLVTFDSPGGYGLIPLAGVVGAGSPEGWLTVQAIAGLEVQP